VNKEQPQEFTQALTGLKNDENFELFSDMIRLSSKKFVEFLPTKEGELIFKKEVSEADFSKFLGGALRDPVSFDKLNQALAIRLLAKHLEVTDQMRLWISGVLTGKVSRPKSKGGIHQSSGFKGVAIATLVFEATEFGLRPTRNVASEPYSASDAVVEALASVGHHTTYEAVAKAWSKYRQVWMKEQLE